MNARDDGELDLNLGEEFPEVPPPPTETEFSDMPPGVDLSGIEAAIESSTVSEETRPEPEPGPGPEIVPAPAVDEAPARVARAEAAARAVEAAVEITPSLRQSDLGTAWMQSLTAVLRMVGDLAKTAPELKAVTDDLKHTVTALERGRDTSADRGLEKLEQLHARVKAVVAETATALEGIRQSTEAEAKRSLEQHVIEQIRRAVQELVSTVHQAMLASSIELGRAADKRIDEEIESKVVARIDQAAKRVDDFLNANEQRMAAIEKQLKARNRLSKTISWFMGLVIGALAAGYL